MHAAHMCFTRQIGWHVHCVIFGKRCGVAKTAIPAEMLGAVKVVCFVSWTNKWRISGCQARPLDAAHGEQKNPHVIGSAEYSSVPQRRGHQIPNATGPAANSFQGRHQTRIAPSEIVRAMNIRRNRLTARCMVTEAAWGLSLL